MILDPAMAAGEIAAANEAYLAGDYGTAVARFEAALEAGAEGADLWFNLGNAHYRAGEQGRAVLAFERVLRRDPGDEGAKQNLALVRSQMEAVVAPPPFIDRIGARTDPDVATALLVVCWSLACLAWVVRRALAAGAARIVATVVLALFLGGAMVAGGATWAAWQLRNDGSAIVVEAGEALRAPEPSAPAVFTAPEGMKVQIDRRVGGYARVRLGDRQGWIEAARIEPIDP